MDLSFLRPRNIFNKKIRILLTGGGSGGHTFPLIAISRELKKIASAQNIELELFYIGPNDFTLPLIQKEIINVKTILAGKMRRGFSWQNFIDFFKTLGGLLQAMVYVYLFMPDLILSKGGYGSFPVAFWGILFLIPTYIHESDSVPGLVNKIIGKFAKEIFISFESSGRYFPNKKTIITGNPIRQDLFDATIDIQATKKLLNLSERPVITIIGGSQGAKNINDLILDILPKIIDDVEIIHQVGENNYDSVLKEAKIIFQEIIQDEEKQQYYHPVAFLEESETPNIKSLKDVILISDLIIARAGSGSIFEIAASGKPSIIIPLPWASQDHQKQNAYEYAKTGAAIVVEEQNLKPNIFADLILQILSNEQKIKEMQKAALAFAKPKAAEQIAQYLIQNT
ncbi:MAG: UDP-N-acetylglucosamine--N-acetylmuramyl-(pentapeptide) pyrophosphoryl-undecaprenol N-acetylglucosamine transferase [Parcubacteria group bacterium]|nr:UDP-N-acetylglucosamine--N-acetylmuramyl-(pentapeptide) pyrophosphoryl-undecaprenol N-acetylglucosamine transferase [Parcubacteria group bacterium]